MSVGENKIAIVHDSMFQVTPKDASLFVSNLKKTLIHLNPVTEDQSYSRINFEAISIIENGYASVLGQSASIFSRRLFHEAHSPPKKESAADMQFTPDQLFPTGQSNFEEQSATSSENKIDDWILKPEELFLDSSSKDSRIALINLSRKDLKFRIECPIDVFSVSPLSGIVPAKGEIGLRCRIIPHSMDKLSGDSDQQIRIMCGSSEKSIRVKIAQDTKRQKETSRLGLGASRRNTMQLRGTTPDSAAAVSSNHDTTSVAFSVRNIFDFPKEITLPSTEPTDTSETLLAFQNTAKNSVHWKIVATTFLFSQSLENKCNEEILKIHPLSGILNPMETCTIAILFSPTDIDSYSQFFEFSVESEKETKEKCNFKITGKGTLNVSSADGGKSIDSSNSSVKGTIKRKKPKTGVYLENDVCKFQSVAAGESSQAYVTINNLSGQDVPVTIIKPKPPFFMYQSSVTVRSKKYLKIPVSFKPTCPVKYSSDKIIFQPENCDNLIVEVKGFCF